MPPSCTPFSPLLNGLLGEVPHDAQRLKPGPDDVVLVVDLRDLSLGVGEGLLDLLEGSGVGVGLLEGVVRTLEGALGLVEECVLVVELLLLLLLLLLAVLYSTELRSSEVSPPLQMLPYSSSHLTRFDSPLVALELARPQNLT